MRNVILVLTNSEDGAHSDVVISKLLAGDESVVRFDVDRFAKGEATIVFSPGREDGGVVICNGDDTVHFCDIKSVWYRRPNHFNLAIQDPVQREYAEHELRSFLDAMWFNLERHEQIFFLSRPSAIEKARRKPYQLNLAERWGMRIPRTIITNDPESIRKFHATCPGGMIFKAVSHEFLNYGERSFNIPTTLVTPALMEKIDLVKQSPAVFQEYLVKEYELRVTVVGKKIFPVKIDSQKNLLSIVDWRNPRCIEKLDYSQTTIEPYLERFCLETLRELGLRFGAFDFVVDQRGDLYFLEVNPNGQWYWLEELTGALISDSIADILKRKGGKP